MNTPGGKAAFYVCHVLPEWLASLTLFADNIRKTFGTGLVGDYRLRDETENEKKSRLARVARRREREVETVTAVELVEKKEGV